MLTQYYLRVYLDQMFKDADHYFICLLEYSLHLLISHLFCLYLINNGITIFSFDNEKLRLFLQLHTGVIQMYKYTYKNNVIVNIIY